MQLHSKIPELLIEYQSDMVEYLLYKAVQVDRFHLCPSNAEHVDCPFDHAYHIIPPNN